MESPAADATQGDRTLNPGKGAGAPLDDVKVHVKIKIAALWASVMFCYIYADYFDLYRPGALQGMLQGKMGPLGPVTQGVLLGTAAVLAIPSLMIFLSLILKPNINRWTNIILGALYTLINLTNLMSSWAFYVFFGVVEIFITALIAWYALSWSNQKPS